MSGFSDGRAYITDLFRQAQQKNFNVFRFFVQGDYSYLTTAPGMLIVWHECQVFKLPLVVQ